MGHAQGRRGGSVSEQLPQRCGKCPMAGLLMCLDKRVPLDLATQFDKRKKPPEWCPLRKATP